MSAQTTVPGAELSNRREIPVTAFDFLDGAYRKAITARRSAVAISALMSVTAAALIALSVPAWNSGTQAQAETELSTERREQLFASLGVAPGTAIGQEALIVRHGSLTDTYQTLLLRSPSLGELIGFVVRQSGPAVASLSIGHSDQLVGAVPGPEGDRSGLGDRLARTRVLVVLRGENIGDAVESAERLRGAQLQITTETRGGVASVTVGAVETTGASLSIEELIQRAGAPASRAEALGRLVEVEED